MASHPSLTRAQSREVDRIAIEELGIPGIVLMENAAASLERAAGPMLGDDPEARTLIIAGPGNNGGDGFALARRLRNADRLVEVVATRGVDACVGDALVNARIIERMGIRIEVAVRQGLHTRLSDWSDPAVTLIVDAMLGTGATRAPEGVVAELVRWVNREHDAGARVLAVDVPTGLDADTGRPLGDPALVVRADRTLTLGSMKVGLGAEGASAWTGVVEVGDIGAPAMVFDRAAGMEPGAGGDVGGGSRPGG
jgi:hydroxyethylthiazole kinase-like uncharacterized protein yjeF